MKEKTAVAGAITAGKPAPAKNNWLVYLLACGDGTLYCGVTNDLEKRLARHNGLLPGGARYTAGRRPVRLLASVPCADKSAALKLERQVKKRRAGRKLAFLLAAGALESVPHASPNDTA